MSQQSVGSENYIACEAEQWRSPFLPRIRSSSEMNLAPNRMSIHLICNRGRDVMLLCRLRLWWVGGTVYSSKGSQTKELFGGTVYSSKSFLVWKDLKEILNKVNDLRILAIHKEINSTPGNNPCHIFQKVRTIIGQLWFNCDTSQLLGDWLRPRNMLNMINNRNYHNSLWDLMKAVLVWKTNTHLNPLPTISPAYSLVD